MDIHTARGLVAALSFALFIGIILWAWSRHQRPRFDEAARLPFNEKD
jgi:cytochrome c oxidase cbb3-type subunit 4